ncbi:MAG: HK97 family phage prohead protease [Sphingobacteriales bacterium]|nr:HK97 family phage prohead protease [Sphingobacteriales bacterium]
MKKSSKTFKVSDLSTNVYGYRVNTPGINMDNFLANPVCLLNHNYDKIMGLWADVQKGNMDMTGVPQFDEEDDEAMKMYNKVEQGLLNGASIGIIPITIKDDEVLECELLEISITPVPANRNALVMYNAERKQLTVEEAKAYCLSINQSDNNPKQKMNPKTLNALVLLCASAGLQLQLSSDAKDEDFAAALNQVGEKFAAQNLTVNTLKTKLTEFENAQKQAETAELTALLDNAISNKLILAADRQAWEDLGKANLELCKRTLSAIKPVELKVVLTGNPSAQADAAGTEKWTYHDWAEKDPIGLAAMQKNDPEKFNHLVEGVKANLKAAGAIA